VNVGTEPPEACQSITYLSPNPSVRHISTLLAIFNYAGQEVQATVLVVQVAPPLVPFGSQLLYECITSEGGRVQTLPSVIYLAQGRC
jgi:hypothetical protein